MCAATLVFSTTDLETLTSRCPGAYIVSIMWEPTTVAYIGNIITSLNMRTDLDHVSELSETANVLGCALVASLVEPTRARRAAMGEPKARKKSEKKHKKHKSKKVLRRGAARPPLSRM